MGLFSFTVAEAIVLGSVGAMYETQSVMFAGGVTAGVFLALTAYACCTKSDFTGMGPYLYAVLSGLCFTSFLFLFFPASETFQNIRAGIGAILFCVYIIYDT